LPIPAETCGFPRCALFISSLYVPFLLAWGVGISVGMRGERVWGREIGNEV